MKKLICALLLLCMLLTLAACSKTDNNIAIPGGNPAYSTPDTSNDPDNPFAPLPSKETVWLVSTELRYDTFGDLVARTEYEYSETGIMLKQFLLS